MERELQSKKSYPPLDIIDPCAEKITVAMKVKSTIGNYCSYDSSEDIHWQNSYVYKREILFVFLNNNADFILLWTV